jgi:hypothetical protein
VGNYSFGDSFQKMYKGAKDELSYEVMELHSEDLSANKQYLTTLMEARLATYEADVMFVADIDDPDTDYKDEKGETQYKHTYLETFIMRYRYSLYNLSDPTVDENSYFKKMETYLNIYYKGDWTNEDNLSKEVVEKDFRARVKKDKRYKKESQLKKGVQDDIERIEKYAEALEKFYWYEEQGVVSRAAVAFEKEDESKEYNYAINLCPQKGLDEKGNAYYPMEKLSSIVSYQEEITYEEEGQTVTKDLPTAKDMNVCLFNFKGVTKGFEYESLLYVVYLIDNCSSIVYTNV